METRCLETPTKVSGYSLGKNGFRAEVRAEFDVGEGKHAFVFPITFDIAKGGEVINREGEKWASEALMKCEEFIWFLKQVAEGNCEGPPEWRARLKVSWLGEKVAMFTLILVWSDEKVEIGTFTVKEFFNMILGDVDLAVACSNTAMGYICPQEERYSKFRIFLNALSDGE